MSAWPTIMEGLNCGKYVERELSLNLPMLRVKDLERFLNFELAADETAWVRKFRAWVRDRFPVK